jgi:ABC-type Fe3+-hydroxamate transport system substrate-binding protein
MAAAPLRSAALALLLALAAGAAGATPRRIVSLNPSLTAILLALGARDALVGVDSFSAQQEPEVAGLPTVGGLYNPSLEAVVALSPDLVVFVPTAEQRGFQQRLEELALPTEAFDPVSFEDVLRSIQRLGARVGREPAARERVEAIRAARRAVEARVAGLPRRRTVLVLQREPLFVVGRGSFVDEMLGAAGAENVGRTLAEPWPRATREWLLDAAPEVIVDASDVSGDAQTHWAQWPSLPAVRDGRVVAVPQGAVALPGPWLDRALERLAAAIHPESASR